MPEVSPLNVFCRITFGILVYSGNLVARSNKNWDEIIQANKQVAKNSIIH